MTSSLIWAILAVGWLAYAAFTGDVKARQMATALSLGVVILATAENVVKMISMFYS